MFWHPKQLLEIYFVILSEKFLLYSFSSTVRDLAVILDSSISFRPCYILSHAFFIVLFKTQFRLVLFFWLSRAGSGFTCFRIDYCNALLIGPFKVLLLPV